MKRFFVLIVVLLNSIFLVYTQSELWKVHNGGAGETLPHISVVDDNNDIYTYGKFKNNVDLGDSSFISNGGTYDLFICKNSSNGDSLWAVHIESNDVFQVGGIDISSDNSLIIISGGFKGTCDFGGTVYSSTGGQDAFIAAYNTVDGSLNYAKRIGKGISTENQFCGTLKIDQNDSIILSGLFADTIIFDLPEYNLGSSGNKGFLAKFDINGNIAWSKGYYSSSYGPNFYSIDISNDGYYLGGHFLGTLDLGVRSITSTKMDILIYKTDMQGNGEWVRQIGGTELDWGFSTISDNTGNVYINGYYNSPTLTIDSTDTETSQMAIDNKGNNDLIFIKYDTDGNLIWVNSFGSDGDDRLYNSSFRNNNLMIAGQLGGEVNFRGDIITPRGGTDAFGLVFDSYDNMVYLFNPGGTLDDAALGSAIDHEGNFILSGYFKSPALYFSDEDSIENDLTGEKDMFIIKYNKMSVNMVATQPDCYGGSNGSISVTPEGLGEEPFTYLWNTGATTQNLNNIPAGWYKVTVTDNTGYVVVDSIYLDQPSDIVVGLTSTSDVSCYGGNDGKINITPSGGTTPYSYAWSTSDGSGLYTTNQDQDHLTKGTYSVIVRDYNFCYDTLENIYVDEPADIVITGIIDTVSAKDAGDGSIDITVTGGTPAYTYLWSNDSITEDIDSLDGGTYTVTVTDNNLCTADTSFFVYEPSALLITYNVTNASCFGDCNGAVDVTVSGGNPGYTFVWKEQGQSDTLDTTEDISGLCAGKYVLQVKDNNGAGSTVSQNIQITEPSELFLSLQSTHISCFGKADGLINAVVVGGTSPYTYHYTKEGDATFHKYTEDITNLTAGVYYDTVYDINGCSKSGIASINEPPVLSFSSVIIKNISCNTGKIDGSISVTPSGGTPKPSSPYYTYLWSNGKTTSTISNLSAATYSVTVRDSMNCPLNGMWTIIKPPPVSLSSREIYPESCYGLTDGWAVIHPASDNGDVVVEWSGPISGTGDTLSNMPVGTYYLVGTDTNNCIAEGQLNMTQPNALTLSIDSQQNITCMGDSTGIIEISATGGTGSYTYAWETSDGGGIIAGSATQNTLAAGSYEVSVFDANLCKDSTSSPITITEPATLVTAAEDIASRINVSCNGLTNGSLTIVASNGTPPYAYSLNRSDWVTDPTFSSIAAGSYTLWVRDATPCISEAANVTISEPEAIAIDSVKIAGETATDANDGKIIIYGRGGTGSLLFTLTPGTTQTDSLFASLAPGNYSISITDNNDCGPLAHGPETVSEYVNINDIISQYQVGVYPNPTKGKAFISLKGYDKPSIQVEVINMNGQKVYTNIFHKPGSGSVLELDLSDQADGIYMLKLNGINTGLQIVIE